MHLLLHAHWASEDLAVALGHLLCTAPACHQSGVKCVHTPLWKLDNIWN